jgi:protoporphyrinogen oxidase
MLDLLGGNKSGLRRSNRIIHKGAFVQYPFENDLSKLPAADREKCVDGFLKNPYRDYGADNMLQFFLKTFGEGITNLYLRPYNEKIWKFDPAFMDTQMVDRIPRPPDEDILRSAAGETVDGYTHQLHFSYPKTGGTAAFIEAFTRKLGDKVKIHTSCEVARVGKAQSGYRVIAGGREYDCGAVVSCLPVNILARLYDGVDAQTTERAEHLRYNNIMIAVATVAIDRAGDNLAFMAAGRGVIFHRLSKLDFFGESYHRPGTATYLMEYTYRGGDRTSELPDGELREMFADGLRKIGFIESGDEILSFTLKRFPYAYVIYDLCHRENMGAIREFFRREGVTLHGRFGNFEYWNMDKVIAESRKIAERF